MRELGRILGGLLLVALAGCASGVEIETSYDPLAVFPAQGTFAWADGANVIPDEVAQLGLAEILPPAVEDALASRGWRKAAPEEANALVSYEVSVYVMTEAAAPGDDEHSRAMGSLSVALLDPKDQRRLWVGFIQADVHPSLSHEERRARVEAALKRLFKEFPP